VPPRPPQVTYQNGQLSIAAENSTLGDILNAVKARTGANIEAGAPGALNERVAARLGPAPPRQVLADLLNGSPFDYVLLGSPTDPNAVRILILTPNPAAAALVSRAAPAGNPASAVAQPPQRRPGMPSVQMGEGGGPEQESLPEIDQEVQDEGPVPVQPSVPEPVPQPPPQSPQGQPGQQQPKTPEQLLQELQKMQQQQQQQQQQPPQ
jgi:hypothetical protein